MKTVNFIEAINSGKRFYPVGRIDGYEHGIYENLSGWDKEYFTKEFINAQFELEEKEIKITRAKLLKAMFNTKSKGWSPFHDEVADNLGL